MHHYDRDTLFQPLGIREDFQHLWREYIPREAIKHPFLMHGILALSALHIAFEQPENADKYLRLCDKHQTKALELFRTVLMTDITPDVSTALFALSTTISILSTARSCADAAMMQEPQFIGMDQVAELFLLTRGIRDLILTCMDWVSAGPLGPMLQGDDLSGRCDTELPSPVQRQFIILEHMLEECCPPEYRLDCEHALRSLEDIYRDISYVARAKDIETQHIWRWMLLAPPDPVRMVTACFPPALIILAHFAAVSLTAQKSWYTRDWGHYVLTGISMTLLGSEMHMYLDWPMEQARTQMAVLTQVDEIDSVMDDR
ncbi:hypothetical protein HII31_08536 [Pseudocercospora fuligena]|uniref:Transcription factor domain-containing protein n=1 Tax=Pseudocercospora fuligena TaxID=685502 RepID=A0A8H6VKM9_9PEZI|nr:hypothetical protein HII31_08536 [Pseudocercospora fuligena]